MSESFITFTEGDTQRTGWSFQCVTASKGSRKPGRGGLVLKDVRHNGHNFASQIRVIGLRLEYTEITRTIVYRSKTITSHNRFLELSPSDFDVSDILELRNFEAGSNPSQGPARVPMELGQGWRALNFQVYPFFFGLEVRYSLKEETFKRLFGENETNVNITGLQLTQTILFSPYQNKPSHEPTGGVMAARIHPLMTTRFTSNDKFDEAADKAITVDSVRYDYYMHKNLDRFDITPPFGKDIDYGQSAAVFKDAEDLQQFAAIGGMVERGPGGAAERSLFLAVEKPLVLEICAKGLREGYPTVIDPNNNRKRIGTWDNIHWWGSGEGLNHTITAPGAFHASHLHWRWGHVVEAGPSIVIDGSGPQYRGGLPPELSASIRNVNEYLQSKRGALIDPRCWKQTIEFAVVYHMKKREPADELNFLDELCFEKFSDLFTKEYCQEIPKKEEREEKTGGNLVLWFSIKVHRQGPGGNAYAEIDRDTYGGLLPQVESGLNGSVFIHGIFFAHDPDLWIGFTDAPMAPGPLLGSDLPLHFPNSKSDIIAERNWERY